MQRQIRILRPIRMNSRRGFALIAAVFLMIVVSSMMLKMISYTTENTQQVLNDYLQEQAALVAYGATEYTLLHISAGNTPATLNMTYPSGTPIFNVTTDITYMWAGGVPLQTLEQDGTVIIDVTVSSMDAAGNRINDMDVPIRYHRRTVQKL